MCSLLLLSFFLNTSANLPTKYFWRKDFISTQRLEAILEDVSLLTLGSLGNYTLVQEVGKYVGSFVKTSGYSYYLVGPLDTLSPDDTDYFYRVNKSPFLTADVYEKFATGLGLAGVIAVFDGRGKIDTNLVQSLISRKQTYPVLVENEDKMNLLKSLGYNSVFIVQSGDSFEFLSGKFAYLNWDIVPPDAEELRKNLLLNSIIYINQGDIHVKKPFMTNGVVVYSSDDFVLNEARKILNKRAGPGRVPW
ncbi:MAG: hypothetical protein ABDH59_05360 [Fervidobacterium sp.]